MADRELDSFIINNAAMPGPEQLVLTVQVGNEIKNFLATFSGNSVTFCDELENILMHKNFDYHREFIKILADLKKGTKIHFPVILFNLKS